MHCSPEVSKRCFKDAGRKKQHFVGQCFLGFVVIPFLSGFYAAFHSLISWTHSNLCHIYIDIKEPRVLEIERMRLNSNFQYQKEITEGTD